MNRLLSLLMAPLLVLTTACSTHYSASSHHGYHGHRHGGVSVGVSGHGHGGGELLGALIVGGIIGHALTEAAEEERTYRRTVIETNDDSDEVANGYPVSKSKPLAVEQSKSYQLGQDGNCYLMESVDGEAQIVSMVPGYSCN